MNTQCTGKDCFSLLKWAGRDKVPVSVTLKTNLTSYIFPSHFLSFDPGQVRLAGPSADLLNPSDPIQEASVSFTRDDFIYSFTVEFLDQQHAPPRDGRWRNELILTVPEALKKTNRRSAGRHVVTGSLSIPVTFCTEDDENTPYHGFLANVSSTGMGLLVSVSDHVTLRPNQKCTLCINPSDRKALLIPARFRHHNVLENQQKAILGFQYQLPGNTMEDARTIAALDQLINHVASASSSPRSLVIA
jgi:hypothetical protein